MNAVGVLLLWSVLCPSFEGCDRPADAGRSPWAVAFTASHPAQIRKPVDRRSHHAPDRACFSPVLWDQDDDSDGKVVGGGDAWIVRPVAADAVASSLFTDSQSTAVWTSCQRTPLRC